MLPSHSEHSFAQSAQFNRSLLSESYFPNGQIQEPFVLVVKMLGGVQYVQSSAPGLLHSAQVE